MHLNIQFFHLHHIKNYNKTYLYNINMVYAKYLCNIDSNFIKIVSIDEFKLFINNYDVYDKNNVSFHNELIKNNLTKNVLNNNNLSIPVQNGGSFIQKVGIVQRIVFDLISILHVLLLLNLNQINSTKYLTLLDIIEPFSPTIEDCPNIEKYTEYKNNYLNKNLSFLTGLNNSVVTILNLNSNKSENIIKIIIELIKKASDEYVETIKQKYKIHTSEFITSFNLNENNNSANAININNEIITNKSITSHLYCTTSKFITRFCNKNNADWINNNIITNDDCDEIKFYPFNDDIQLFLKSYRLETEAIYKNYELLYRGVGNESIDQHVLNAKHISLSYNVSLLNGIFFDYGFTGACTYDYIMNGSLLKIIRINNDNSNFQNIYFIPPINPFFQVCGYGELWHVRSKTTQFPNNEIIYYDTDTKMHVRGNYGIYKNNNTILPDYLTGKNNVHNELAEFENNRQNYTMYVLEKHNKAQIGGHVINYKKKYIKYKIKYVDLKNNIKN